MVTYLRFLHSHNRVLSLLPIANKSVIQGNKHTNCKQKKISSLTKMAEQSTPDPLHQLSCHEHMLIFHLRTRHYCLNTTSWSWHECLSPVNIWEVDQTISSVLSTPLYPPAIKGKKLPARLSPNKINRWQATDIKKVLQLCS